MSKTPLKTFNLTKNIPVVFNEYMVYNKLSFYSVSSNIPIVLQILFLNLDMTISTQIININKTIKEIKLEKTTYSSLYFVYISGELENVKLDIFSSKNINNLYNNDLLKYNIQTNPIIKYYKNYNLKSTSYITSLNLYTTLENPVFTGGLNAYFKVVGDIKNFKLVIKNTPINIIETKYNPRNVKTIKNGTLLSKSETVAVITKVAEKVASADLQISQAATDLQIAEVSQDYLVSKAISSDVATINSISQVLYGGKVISEDITIPSSENIKEFEINEGINKLNLTYIGCQKLEIYVKNLSRNSKILLENFSIDLTNINV